MSSILIPAPATTSETTLSILSEMSAQTGVLTDNTPGSQIRTFSESVGSICEEQSIIAQTLAFQNAVYSAFATFRIYPLPAAQAVGSITIATANSVPATFSVAIPAGTLFATTQGIKFQTTASVTLLVGTTAIVAPIIAVNAGTSGNVSSGTITTMLSTIPYPVTVSNPAATTLGASAEPIQSTMARFTASVAAIGTSTPVSIANAAIGVMAASSTEIVQYATVYEVWIYQVANSITPVTPGFQLIIDNGGGTASSALITAVTNLLNGSFPNEPGYRDAGVPFTVTAVVPTLFSVTVTATLINTNNSTVLSAAAQNAANTYFSSLGFAQTIYLAQITAAVAAVLDGYVTALSVVLKDSSNTVQTSISPGSQSRMLLSSYSSSIS